MSAGNRFGLNDESAALPRLIRGLLYFGYALLTVASMNWLAAGHQVIALAQKEQVGQNGSLGIGLPFAFWALIVGSEAVLGAKDEWMTGESS